MDARAQHRLYVLNHILTGGLTAEEAARVLGLSVRQVRRLVRRYRADGSAGLRPRWCPGLTIVTYPAEPGSASE